MTVLHEPLVEMIARRADVPCFIVAPARTGKTTLAMTFAQSHYALDEVLWVNGSVKDFGDELKRGALQAYLKGEQTPDASPRRLFVIDDLARLDTVEAACFSDCIDDLVEQGRQLIVICAPENDCYDELQSDRLLIEAEHLAGRQAPNNPLLSPEAPIPTTSSALASSKTSGGSDGPSASPAQNLSVIVPPETYAVASDEHFEPLEVQFFGGFAVWKGSERIDALLARRSKVQALFIHLALNLERGVARDSLLSRLWPEKSYDAAVENFYTTWSRLKALLGGGAKAAPYLSYDRQVCRLQAAYVNLDLTQFENLARIVLFCQGKPEERIDAIYRMERLYRGDLLAAVPLDRHAQALQTRYRSLQVDAMLIAAQLFSEIGNATTAVWFARYAYDLDPGREDVYRVLMDMQDRAGQRTSALRTYFDCKRYLSEELGLSPSQKTIDLYQELILDRR
ncbi:MAG: bacterial transcriptional activator domain-containing protein [Coriobacteriales bacterium]|jgi:DNA-binding SARP family transcriptional activator|nr:bacterial transcriptional activator domain-containing protein [Coriobacteriales bacterium]